MQHTATLATMHYIRHPFLVFLVKIVPIIFKFLWYIGDAVSA